MSILSYLKLTHHGLRYWNLRQLQLEENIHIVNGVRTWVIAGAWKSFRLQAFCGFACSS
ncbi:hypothetical protein K443DRAFT_581784 [Laccaria amethystina LaAM-08-1]|uniref:Uncharacterized protein n=1 Tax=Laccaria amethystina LaAM-08-1 TaxID=1095629 RepID=A0A0C9WRC4_9AGAR|nr:hypothetical protein K443DRAFT_581784 [Laccaria amethystina LaAM-08-1]